MNKSTRYSPEVRERAVRMVFEHEMASAFFRPGGARPPTKVMVTYIDGHKNRFGVEPICAVLPISLMLQPATG